MTWRESRDGDSDEQVYLGEKTRVYRWEEGYIKGTVIEKKLEMRLRPECHSKVVCVVFFLGEGGCVRGYF